MRWGRLIKLREKTNGKKTRSSTLTTGNLSGSKKCWPSLLFCCLWIFQELLQQSLSWPKMFAHSWSGLQVRDSFFSPISGKLRAFAIYQKTSETSVESAIGWRTCAILHSFLSLSLFSKVKMAGQILPWIAWIWWILLKNWKWNSYFHLKNFQPEN